MTFWENLLGSALGRLGLAAGIIVLLWAASRIVKSGLMPYLIRITEGERTRVLHIFAKAFAKPLPALLWLSGICLAIPLLPLEQALSAGQAAKLSGMAFRVVSLLCAAWSLVGTSDVCSLLVSKTNEALDVETNQTLLTLLKKLYKGVVVVFAVLAALDALGYPVTSLVTGVGLVGLTVSLAAQDSASNLFSGLMILMEKPFAIGDWVNINGVEGAVEDLGFRSTKIRALDNSLYVLPNSTVTSSTVNNGAARVKRLYRFTLGVTYNATRQQLESLMAHLTEMLLAHPKTEKESVMVRLTGFGTSSIDMMVSSYILEPNMADFMAIQNDLNLALLDIVRQEGLQFAFPSTSVYIEKNTPPQ